MDSEKSERTIQVVCGWHQQYFGQPLVMGEKTGQFKEGDVSHSICPDCVEVMR